MHVPESSLFYAFKIFNHDDEARIEAASTERNYDTQVSGGSFGSIGGEVGGYQRGTQLGFGSASGGAGDSRMGMTQACRDDDVERRDDNQGEEHGENDVSRQPEERSVEGELPL